MKKVVKIIVIAFATIITLSVASCNENLYKVTEVLPIENGKYEVVICSDTHCTTIEVSKEQYSKYNN